MGCAVSKLIPIDHLMVDFVITTFQEGIDEIEMRLDEILTINPEQQGATVTRTN